MKFAQKHVSGMFGETFLKWLMLVVDLIKETNSVNIIMGKMMIKGMWKFDKWHTPNQQEEVDWVIEQILW